METRLRSKGSAARRQSESRSRKSARHWKKEKKEKRNWEQLPPTMFSDIVNALHRDMVEKVPLFRGCEPAFMTAVVTRLNPTVYLAGQVVVRRGDVGHFMAFISSGAVRVVNESDVIPRTPRRGWTMLYRYQHVGAGLSVDRVGNLVIASAHDESSWPLYYAVRAWLYGLGGDANSHKCRSYVASLAAATENATRQRFDRIQHLIGQRG